MNRPCDLPLPERRHSRARKTHDGVRRSIGRRAEDHALVGKHPIASGIFRALLYITITAGFVKSIFFAVQHMDAAVLFAENGIMEWFQFGSLLLCAVLLKVASLQMHTISHGFHILALLPLIAAVRELDAVLDQYAFDGAWQLVVTMLLVYMFAYARRHYRALKQQILVIFSFPSTGLLLSGFVTIIVFSRLFGQQLFWQAVLQENYIRLVARTVEEGCEFFGYLLLLFGCIEYVVIALSSRVNSHARIERVNV